MFIAKFSSELKFKNHIELFSTCLDGGVFLRSLVLCFKPTLDWAVETFLIVNLKFD